MVFCYVILHYKTDEDTIECINSVFESDANAQIVVVDNASGNGSIEKVEEQFKNFENVYILKNEENLGFAAGNNVGYEFARNTLHADFIAVSNNDVIIVTPDFSEKVKNVYDKTDFSILGPDIVSIVDGGHQNPMEESYTTLSQVKKEIRRYKLLYTLSRMGIYDILKPNRKVRTGFTKKEVPSEIKENVMLHGSFMIFSPRFIEKEEIAFRKGTFLYVEEAILKRYCDRENYKMVFCPNILVNHKEDSSTNSLKLSNRERREFVFKNMIRSLGVYKDYFD